MDISKQDFTLLEFAELLGYKTSWFRKKLKEGIIPPADDTDFTPHTWHRATVLRTIDELNPPQPQTLK